MRSKLIAETNGQRTFALVFDAGDEAMEGLTRFAHDALLTGAHFTGIGAFSDAVLGYFDWAKKEYRPLRVDEQVEVVSLVGDVADDDGSPAVHAHVVVATFDGTARGGHLLAAHVRPTLEVIVSDSPAHLRKRHDAASGLALIALDAPDSPAAQPPQGEAGLSHVDDADIVGGQAQRLVAEDADAPRSSTEEGAGLEP
jgi:predicted DNA-binding protein with PD1-like motif